MNKKSVWVDSRLLCLYEGLPESAKGRPASDFLRFDSKFEADTYILLRHHFPSGKGFVVERQYKVPLQRVNNYICPQRGDVWRADFAIFHPDYPGEWSRDDIVTPFLYVEAKGKVSREFKLLLSLVPGHILERTLVVFQRRDDADKFKRCTFPENRRCTKEVKNILFCDLSVFLNLNRSWIFK